jgi:hypothetical protein
LIALIGHLASVLCNRFIQAIEMVQLTNQMSTTVSASLRNKWETEIKTAESDRLSNPAGMDIMGAKETDPNPDPTPSRPDVGRSGLQWVALAISIEERQ